MEEHEISLQGHDVVAKRLGAKDFTADFDGFTIYCVEACGKKIH
jgi:hypothetical protein